MPIENDLKRSETPETSKTLINLTPTHLQSWVEWRKVYTRGPVAFNLLMEEYGLTDRLPYYFEYMDKNNGECPYCHTKNDLQIIQSERGTVYCICGMLGWMQSDIYRYNFVRSSTLPAYLEDLDMAVKSTPDVSHDEALIAQKEFIDAIKAADAFIKDPTRWMVLSGLKGTGKTHILRAINTAMWPMAVYVTTGDLERMVHEARHDDTINELDKILSYAPILLLDDIGMEYGGPLVKSLIEKIINVRYEQREILPTVASTNLSPARLIEYIPRAADRLMDREISQTFLLTHKSYRTIKPGTK